MEYKKVHPIYLYNKQHALLNTKYMQHVTSQNNWKQTAITHAKQWVVKIRITQIAYIAVDVHGSQLPRYNNSTV